MIFEKSSKKVAIIGQGYVGFPLALSAASAGWKVVGIDNSSSVIESLEKGFSPFESISSDLLRKLMRQGNLFFTTDYSQVEAAQIVVICVPTPLFEDGTPNLGYLEGAVSQLIPHVQSHTLIINESTSYPGTLRNMIANRIVSSSGNIRRDLFFAAAPERVNPGDKNWNLLNTPRVIAGIDNDSHRYAVDFYKSFCETIIEASSPEVAEASKLLENSFRLVNISFFNEFALICNSEGIDANEVIRVASSKPFGFLPFAPGIGAGGHCIPIDPQYFVFWAKQKNQESSMINAATKINQQIPKLIARKACDLLGNDPLVKTVLLVGLSYKSDLADTRESQAIAVLNELRLLGIRVNWHDSLVETWNSERSCDIDSDFDLAVLATLHSSFETSTLISQGKPILNCSGKFVGGDKTIDLYST
jgi:UDP-N-acetyl-D-glucosamine dehydrogenase